MEALNSRCRNFKVTFDTQKTITHEKNHINPGHHTRRLY